MLYMGYFYIQGNQITDIIAYFTEVRMSVYDIE